MKKYVAMAAMFALTSGIVSWFGGGETAIAATRQDDAAKKEEADLYGKLYEAIQAKDCAKVLELGKEFIQKFPNAQHAGYVKDKAIPGCRTALLNKAVEQKNVPEILKLGKDVLAADPENIDFLVFLAGQLGQNEVLASPPNFTHATDAADFAARSVRLIESGKMPSGQYIKKEATLAYLYRIQAVIGKNNKNTDKAIEHYQKAASYEPNNPQWFLSCGSLHQEKYAAAATKFQAFPDEDKSAEPDKMKPEVKTALDAVNKEADAVIQCWARFVGLTLDKKDWDATRGQVQRVLTELYKFRHDGKEDGLQKLIDQNRPGSPASNGSTASK
jgi:tetratricopeptide (TPR) repeat protein